MGKYHCKANLRLTGLYSAKHVSHSVANVNVAMQLNPKPCKVSEFKVVYSEFPMQQPFL